MTRRWLLWLSMLTCLLLASCSGDGDDDASSTPSVVPDVVTPSAGATPARAMNGEPTAAPTATIPPSATVTSTATQVPMSPSPTSTEERASVFDPNSVSLDVELVAEGFNEPLLVTRAADGRGQLFVVERGGTIRLLSGELMLDITERVGSESTEQGLLGLALHPRVAENGGVFVYYTDVNGDTVVSRFQMTDGVIDPGSEQVVLTQEQPASNHNGGMLAFGPDGFLYIGLGDGGRSYDAFGTAQDLGSLLGKLLRIDVDSADGPYGIPQDNPFAGADGARPEVWAYGLRNPWRFSFDPATGDLYIGDVGQNMYEWVHFQPADSPGGENYGWPIFEGDHCLIEERCDDDGFVPPIAVYGRDEGCAIIGGHVYRGQEIPNLSGAYVFGDLCTGNIWAAARTDAGEWESTRVLQVDARLSSFGVDEAGNLFITDLAGGRVLRLVEAAGS